MSENPTGILSFDEAAEMLMEPEEATPETEEAQQEESDTEETEAVEETEAEEAEGETEEAEVEAEEEDAEPEEEDDDPLVTVKVDGKTSEVPFSEVVKGYQRQEDYTRKTMEISEQRNALQREMATVQDQKAQLMEALAHFAIPTDQQPNWEELAYQLSPQEYNQQRALWDRQQVERQQARQMHQSLQKQQRQQKLAAEQAKLLEAVPEWRDPKAFQRAAQEMVSAGGEYGFSQEEVAALSDHRLLRALHDLSEFKRMKASANAAAKKVSAVKPKLKAGSKGSKVQQSQKARQEKMNRLKMTGSVEDAVSLLLG